MKIEALENRALLSGQLASGFGTTGLVTTDIGGALDQTNATAVQGDGKIVSVGTRFRLTPTPLTEAYVVRHTSIGGIDSSFGTGGIVIPSLAGVSGAEAYAVAVQSDGKILLASKVTRSGTAQDFAITRLLSTGLVDPGFGASGTTFVDFSNGDDAPGAIAIQSDGKILVAGRATLSDPTYGFVVNHALVRLSTTGALDSTLAGSGKLTLAMNVDGQEISQANALAVTSAGKIILAGSTQSGDISLGTLATRFSLAQLSSTGAADATFNTTGRVLTNFPAATNIDQINAIRLQADGKIVAVGSTQLDSGAKAWAMARYQTTGSPDGAFGTSGLKVISFSAAANADESATGVWVQGDGKIVVTGTSGNTSSPYRNFAICQLAANGSLVSTFGTAGSTSTDFGISNDDQSRASVMLSDGSFVLAGSTYSASLGRYIHGMAKYVGDPLTISGTLYADTNGNRVKDAGETGASGWTLFLDTNKNGVQNAGETTTVTDSLGNYSFSNLSAGAYRVAVVGQTGWRVSYPTTGYQDVVTGVLLNSSARNFGMTQRILISGQVFNDLNGDGIRNNVSEAFLSGRRVFIDLNNDGIWQSTEASVLTDSTGNFSFYTLTAGTYVIRVVNPGGWTTTTPVGGSFTRTLTAGGTSTTNLFGQKLI